MLGGMTKATPKKAAELFLQAQKQALLVLEAN